jgi:uncharacterized protein YjbI with pentapeptide repeats
MHKLMRQDVLWASALVTLFYFLAGAKDRNLSTEKLFIAAKVKYSREAESCVDIKSNKPSPLQVEAWGHCLKFRGKALMQAKLKNHVLDGSDLAFVRFKNTDIENVQGFSVILSEATVLKSNFNNVRLVKAEAKGTIIKHSHFANFSFAKSRFLGAQITRSHFTGGDFLGADFQDAQITDTIFTDVILPADLKSKAVLINVQFNNCRFEP